MRPASPSPDPPTARPRPPHGPRLASAAPQDAAHAGKRIILYSSDEPDKKANAAVLMVLYAVSPTPPSASRVRRA